MWSTKRGPPATADPPALSLTERRPRALLDRIEAVEETADLAEDPGFERKIDTASVGAPRARPDLVPVSEPCGRASSGAFFFGAAWLPPSAMLALLAMEPVATTPQPIVIAIYVAVRGGRADQPVCPLGPVRRRDAGGGRTPGGCAGRGRLPGGPRPAAAGGAGRRRLFPRPASRPGHPPPARAPAPGPGPSSSVPRVRLEAVGRVDQPPARRRSRRSGAVAGRTVSSVTRMRRSPVSARSPRKASTGGRCLTGYHRA